MQKAIDYKILYRPFEGDGAVIVDHKKRVIRAKKNYDWEEIFPKFGEAIARKANLPQSDAMNNYIADWILTGALNNTSTEAKDFQKAMADNPKLFEDLQDIQEEIQAFQNMSANEQMKETIVSANIKQPKSLKDKARETYTTYFDDKAGLEFLVDDIREEFGEEVADNLNPHFQAAMSEGADGIAQLLLDPTKGGSLTDKDIAHVHEALEKKYPMMTQIKRLVPLAKIIQKIGGNKKLKDFSAFLVAKQYKELYEINRKLGEEKYYTGKYSEKQLDEIIAEGEKQFGEAQQDMVFLNNFIATIRYDAGLLSKKHYHNMMKAFKNYASPLI